MIPPARPLREVRAERPAGRQHHGTRPPFVALRALAGSALLCGYRSDPALAAWGRQAGAPLVQACGLTPRSPGAAPRPTVWRRGARAA
jgi:hypothetical protein